MKPWKMTIWQKIKEINMESIKKTGRIIRAVIMILYAIFLIGLVPVFFLNYNSSFIQDIAKALPIREISHKKISAEKQAGVPKCKINKNLEEK